MKKSHDILRTTEDIFYREIAREWLEYSEFRLKESSYAKYRSILNKYLLPAFGNDCISQLTTDRVAEFLKNLRVQETETIRKRLSPQYINGILTVFRETSYYSTSRGYPFPCNFRYLSQKTEKKECSVFTHEESHRLASYLLEDVDLYKAGILLCFFTGIRLGELCALKWEDIHLEEQMLTISHTMQRLAVTDIGEQRTKIVITAPKTSSSKREIPLPDFLFEIVKKFYCSEKDAFFLSGTADKIIEPRVMQYRFRKYTKECGIRSLNFHALRHTFATQCVERDFELKSLSEILGHSSVNITLNRYVHSSRELKRKNMDKICLERMKSSTDQF